eukprot:TRINITY_DN32010_c0_g1_i1.p1 TRINITY_DN32010_c0_g1~~TRINITY_DN32010_c0_g1_i1.p1  ORF type:complete len:528 (+),score=84.67 TRINITY_DN32010_c0_g1_i1:166-1584(+)
MATVYEDLCEQFKWPRDEALSACMKKTNEETLKRLDDAVADAQENLGETEVREALLAKFNHFLALGEKENALAVSRTLFEKQATIGQKLDLTFALLRLGFYTRDLDLLTQYVDKARALVEEGGDWERRNRLKVYEGVFHMVQRNFNKAALLFLDSISTFTSYELITYNQFIFVTVVMCLVSLDRGTMRAKVIHAPEVLASLRELPDVKNLLYSLFECKYDAFFHALPAIIEQLKLNRYLERHVRFWTREMCIVAYSQFLESYRSVTVESMARAFGVSEEWMDRELSRFIAAGRLNAKVDKVGGIVETNRPDSRNHHYLEMIKHGDVLLNRLQKLSRVIHLQTVPSAPFVRFLVAAPGSAPPVSSRVLLCCVPLNFRSAILSSSWRPTCTRPNLSPTPLCSTFFFFMGLTAFGLLIASLAISALAHCVRRGVKSSWGPISTSSTLGNRVPELFNCTAQSLKRSFPWTAVHTRT